MHELEQALLAGRDFSTVSSFAEAGLGNLWLHRRLRAVFVGQQRASRAEPAATWPTVTAVEALEAILADADLLKSAAADFKPGGAPTTGASDRFRSKIADALGPLAVEKGCSVPELGVYVREAALALFVFPMARRGKGELNRKMSKTVERAAECVLRAARKPSPDLPAVYSGVAQLVDNARSAASAKNQLRAALPTLLESSRANGWDLPTALSEMLVDALRGAVTVSKARGALLRPDGSESRARLAEQLAEDLDKLCGTAESLTAADFSFATAPDRWLRTVFRVLDAAASLRLGDHAEDVSVGAAADAEPAKRAPASPLQVPVPYSRMVEDSQVFREALSRCLKVSFVAGSVSEHASTVVTAATTTATATAADGGAGDELASPADAAGAVSASAEEVLDHLLGVLQSLSSAHSQEEESEPSQTGARSPFGVLAAAEARLVQERGVPSFGALGLGPFSAFLTTHADAVGGVLGMGEAAAGGDSALGQGGGTSNPTRSELLRVVAQARAHSIQRDL